MFSIFVKHGQFYYRKFWGKWFFCQFFYRKFWGKWFFRAKLPISLFGDQKLKILILRLTRVWCGGNHSGVLIWNSNNLKQTKWHTSTSTRTRTPVNSSPECTINYKWLFELNCKELNLIQITIFYLFKKICHLPQAPGLFVLKVQWGDVSM